MSHRIKGFSLPRGFLFISSLPVWMRVNVPEQQACDDTLLEQTLRLEPLCGVMRTSELELYVSRKGELGSYVGVKEQSPCQVTLARKVPALLEHLRIPGGRILRSGRFEQSFTNLQQILDGGHDGVKL